MTKKTIAVEENLGNVKAVLQERGFDIVSVDRMSSDVQAVVISGMDENLMQIQDRVVGAPVISAAGRTAEEVLAEIQRRIP
ncbi:MAG: YkuS family protein [Limnochordia bacterium]|nr:YkuS family protein [Limnochordia bacterium]MDD2628610.1 YkuS family protein [Limnochordia bacterium]MDD4518120.1 YkuS family protein [Limnochordia bacterium]